MIFTAAITIPTNAVTFVDNSTAFKNIGQHINGVNSFTATGHATVSGTTSKETVKYRLDIAYSKKGEQYAVYVYRGTNSSSQTFTIPNITLTNASSTAIFYWYIVSITDDKGAETLRQEVGPNFIDTLEVYTPPTMTSLSAERYTIRPTDTGSGNILVADNSGEYVRFNFTLKPAVITNYSGNSWTLNVKATSTSGTTKSKNSAYTGTTAGITKTLDATIFPSASYTFSAIEDWTFTFTITDKVTSVSYTCQVASANSILNVEPDGVAIGGFLSTTGAFVNNNILRGTGSPQRLPTISKSGTWADGTWCIGSSGTGTGSIIAVSDCPDAGITAGFRISNNTGGRRDICQYQIPLTSGQTFTVSVWAKVPSGSAKLSAYFWDYTANNYAGMPIDTTVTGTSWQHFSGSVSFTGDSTNCSICIGTQGTASAIDLCGFKLEKGNVINPTWAPAPQDNAEVATFDKPKRFEVAGDCGTILRGGLWDPLGYRMDYVNNTMLLPIDNTMFEPYSRHDEHYDVDIGDTMPMLSRVGPIVFMEGVLKNVKPITLDLDGIKLCTLPSWARPRMRISQVCQGTNTNVFWTHVEATGDVVMSRYRTGTSYAQANTGAQFQFTMCWLAADAAPPLPDIPET